MLYTADARAHYKTHKDLKTLELDMIKIELDLDLERAGPMWEERLIWLRYALADAAAVDTDYAATRTGGLGRRGARGSWPR